MVEVGDKAEFVGGEDKAKFNEKQADKTTPLMFTGQKVECHIWADRVRAWAASLTDNGLEIFQYLDQLRSEHDHGSLELRWAETKDL